MQIAQASIVLMKRMVKYMELFLKWSNQFQMEMLSVVVRLFLIFPIRKIFTREIVDWYFDQRETFEAIELLGSLIDVAISLFEISLSDMRAFPEDLLHFFDVTPWLERYDLFLVLTQQPREPAGMEGKYAG